MPGKPFEPRGVDALGETQSHQQEFVRALAARQHLVADDAMAIRLDPHEPGFRTLLGRGGVALAANVEAPVRARTDARIFVAAPVDEVVPAFAAGAGVGGDLLGRKPVAGASGLRSDGP